MDTQNPEQGDLSRSLSHGQMTMIALGSALGTGLFLGSNDAIAVAGPAVVVSYAIGALIAAVITCAAGEMAVRYPVRGGFGAIAGRYLGPFGGYITRWAYWATTTCVAGAELVAVSTYLKYWWPQLPLWVGIVVFGLIILFLNAYSVKSFGTVEFLLSSIKVVAVIAFIAIGLLLIVFGLPGHPAAGTGNLTSHGGFMPNGLSSIWLSLAVVMFSFGGVELISISAAEAKDPVRSVRSAAKATIYRLATFYVLALFVILCLLPWDQLASSEGGLASSPFVMVFAVAHIPAAAAIINFVVLVAALSAANANVYAATRLIHSLSHEGMAPKALRPTTRTGSPLRAVLVSSVGILAVVVMALFTEGVFVLMMSVIMTFVLLVWILILASYVVFRGRHGTSRTFSLWGGRTTATIGIVALAAIFVALFVRPDMRVAGLYALGFLLVLGAVYAVALRNKVHDDASAFEEAEVATTTTSLKLPQRED